MGLYQNFPYLDWEHLNIDWVLAICKRAEETIKNLNTQIETVVRPMIIEQQQYIQEYYNQLRAYMDNAVNKTVAENKKLQANVNKQLYANSLEMGQLRSYVTISNRETISKVELEISKLRSETSNLIAKYDTIWNAMSVRQQAQIKKIISDFTIEYNAALLNNAAKMDLLQKNVNSQLSQMQRELDSAIASLQRQMYDLDLRVQQELGQAIDIFTQLSKHIADIVENNTREIHDFYDKVEQLFDSVSSMLNTKIDTKADLSYVDEQLAEIRKLIVHVNGEITVINPVTEQPDSLQDTLYSLYNTNNFWNLTAAEYDALEIRAKEYDEISENFMNAWDYDQAGKWYLQVFGYLYYLLTEKFTNQITKLRVWTEQEFKKTGETIAAHYKEFKDCCNLVQGQIANLLYMDSPFTGYNLPLKNIILQIINVINTGAIRADVYDSIGLEAQAYDGYNLTAYDYDWNAAHLIT